MDRVERVDPSIHATDPWMDLESYSTTYTLNSSTVCLEYSLAMLCVHREDNAYSFVSVTVND